MIRNLRKILGLRVVPPPSAFAFSEDKTRPYIRSRIPGVAYVVDGLISVERENTVRIAFELDDIRSDGPTIWDNDYFSNADSADELFNVQAEVAKSVGASLKVALLDREVRELEAVRKS